MYDVINTFPVNGIINKKMTLKTDKKKDVTDIDEGTFTHKTEERV